MGSLTPQRTCLYVLMGSACLIVVVLDFINPFVLNPSCDLLQFSYHLFMLVNHLSCCKGPILSINVRCNCPDHSLPLYSPCTQRQYCSQRSSSLARRVHGFKTQSLSSFLPLLFLLRFTQPTPCSCRSCACLQPVAHPHRLQHFHCSGVFSALRDHLLLGLSNWEGQERNCYCSASFCASLTLPSPSVAEQISTTSMTPWPTHFLHQVAANLPLILSRPVPEPLLASHPTTVCHMLSSWCMRCFGSISWVRRQCVSVSCEVDSMFFLPLLSSTIM